MIEYARRDGCVSRSSRAAGSCRLIARRESPQAAAAACGASRATGYRLWRRYQEGGWAALRRPPAGAQAPAAAALARARAAHPGGARVREGGAADRRRLSSACRPRPSGRCCAATASRACGGRRADRSSATSASGRASSSTSTSRSSAASGRSASASTATGSTRNRHAGWQYLHLAIDDHSRLAYAELLPSESPADCVAFLRRAVGWYRERGIAVERVLTDNGNGYRSHAWAAACAELGIARRYTRPTPPADQRQGRSARQDAAARVGLPLRLPDQQPPRPSTPRLPPLVQPTPTAQLTRRPAADQPRLTGRGSHN